MNLNTDDPDDEPEMLAPPDDTFDPGDPVGNDADPRGPLVADEDGAPLPNELQRGGRVDLAVRADLAETLHMLAEDSVDDAATGVLVALTPILWPLLPSNDNSEVANLRQTLRNVAALIEPAMAAGTFPSQRREWLGDAQAAIRGALT